MKVIKKIVSYTPHWLFNAVIFFVSIFLPRKKVKYLDLNTIFKDQGSDCFATNKIVDFIYDLKVIIPCYNVQKYIGECIASIKKQITDKKVAVVFVNDGSTDSTKEVIEKEINEYKGKIKLSLVDKTNGGLSSARNAALETINSRYITFVDGDDLLLSNFALQNMIETADEMPGNLKVVQFLHSSNLEFKNKKRRTIRANADKLSGFAWGKIYSSELFSDCAFPLKYWFEDTLNPFIIFPKCESVYLCNQFVYFYRLNEEGITNTARCNNKTLDTLWITKKLISNRKHYKLPEGKSYLNRICKQIVCNAYRFSSFSNDIKYSVFIESMDFIRDYNNLKSYKFGPLIRSLKTNNFKLYCVFCKMYSKLYF